jgi:ketosteroid isomerase-like protein
VGKTVSRGYDGLVERYQKAYGDKEKMGKLTFSELEYTGLGENNAFLIGRFRLERSDAGGGNASGRFTVIFRKTADGWKIIHDHTSGD